MGTWHVDAKSKPGILTVRLSGVLTAHEMLEFFTAHNAAVDSFAGKVYRVFVDIRELAPLSPECTAMMEKAKQYSARHTNFQGSAVLTPSSAVVAMQHRRTSQTGGVIDSELMSDDEAACWDHLANVKRG